MNPFFTEYSVKVTSHGLNPFRMIRGYEISKYPDQLRQYVKDNYPDDFLKFYNEHDSYEHVIFGVDGQSGVKKLYLEHRDYLRSMECKGSQRKYKMYREQQSPRLCRSWELNKDFTEVLNTLTTSVSVFQPMHTQFDVLLKLCKRYASAYFKDFKEWLDTEKTSTLNWLGVGQASFTVYYA